MIQTKTEVVENFFSCTPKQLAKAYGFAEYTQCILDLDENTLKQKYPVYYNSIYSCTYAKDNRKGIEFARDIVISWLFEEFIQRGLQSVGINTQRNGCDKDLMFVSSDKVTVGSDLRAMINNASRKIEVLCDYTGYWRKSGNLELRDSKYQRLCKENAIALGLSAKDHYMLIIDFSKPIKMEHLEDYAPFGGKPASRIQITNDMMFPIDFTVIKKYISK